MDLLLEGHTLVGGRLSVPTREAACTVRCSFQGLWMQTQRYGPLPWWPAGLTAFEHELDAILDQLLAAGDTHCQVDLVWDYGEPGQPWGSGRLVPSVDLRHNLPRYRAIVDRVIDRGLSPIFMMPGEGQEGLRWIFDHFRPVVAALREGYDRTAYGPFWFGYDGTWPAAWTVRDMKRVLPFIRSVIGDRAYFGLMFSTGPAGNPYLFVEDQGDYAKPWMQAIDIIMASTHPDQVECPALVNSAQYMLGPALRPGGRCTPDWHAPSWLLAPGTPRGPYYWGWIEWNAYEWVRGWVTAEKIAADRARMRSVGITLRG